MLHAALTVVLAVAPPLLTAEGVELDAFGKKPWEAPFIGVQVDVGVPDGIGASLMVMPGRFLRIHAGGLNNGVGSGVRFGATLVAFPSFGFRPLLGVDAGHTFGGAGEWLPNVLGNTQLANALSGASISFASAQIGLELGSPTFALTLRAGASWVDVSVNPVNVETSANTSVSASGIVLRGFMPSARLGFLFCFD